jgi:hypothetical protein
MRPSATSTHAGVPSGNSRPESETRSPRAGWTTRFIVDSFPFIAARV